MAIFTFAFFSPIKLHWSILVFTHNIEDAVTKSGEYEYNLPSVFLEDYKPDHSLILYLRWLTFNWC